MAESFITAGHSIITDRSECRKALEAKTTQLFNDSPEFLGGFTNVLRFVYNFLLLEISVRVDAR